MLLQGRKTVLLMYDTDDIVNRIVVNRQTGIAALGKALGDLVHRGVVGHGHNIHAGVSTSWASTSSNSMALRISSLSRFVSSPSFSASLTMVTSSPSVMVSFSPVSNRLARNFFHAPNKAFSGVKS